MHDSHKVIRAVLSLLDKAEEVYGGPLPDVGFAFEGEGPTALAGGGSTMAHIGEAAVNILSHLNEVTELAGAAHASDEDITRETLLRLNALMIAAASAKVRLLEKSGLSTGATDGLSSLCRISATMVTCAAAAMVEPLPPENAPEFTRHPSHGGRTPGSG